MQLQELQIQKMKPVEAKKKGEWKSRIFLAKFAHIAYWNDIINLYFILPCVLPLTTINYYETHTHTYSIHTTGVFPSDWIFVFAVAR